jgi:hypothetical protein
MLKQLKLTGVLLLKMLVSELKRLYPSLED